MPDPIKSTPNPKITLKSNIFTLASVSNKNPVFIAEFVSYRSFLRTIARSAFWHDVADSKGSRIDPKQALDLMDKFDRNFKAQKVKEIAAAHYTVEQLVDAYNAYGGNKFWSAEEEALYGRLATKGYIKKTAAGTYSLQQNASLIFLPNGSTKSEKTHEISHALYKQNKNYKENILKIWNKLGEGQRNNITRILKREGYSNESVVTEFAAYVLELEFGPAIKDPHGAIDGFFGNDKKLAESVHKEITKAYNEAV